MPRARAQTPEDVLAAAMRQFWQHGYHATSVQDLVRSTGTSRHILYSDAGGKHELYTKCFAAYREQVVDPAARVLEESHDGLEALAAYFEMQICLAEKDGLPGPGCMIANAMTEIAPHDPAIAALVTAHHNRLTAAFAAALRRAAPDTPDTETEELAEFLFTSAQGLWALSRTVKTAAPSRSYAATLLDLISSRFHSS